MKKRVLSMLLALTLLLAIPGLSASVWADGNTVTYTMKAGDTVIQVCESLGLDFNTCRAAIMQLNHFSSDAAFRTIRAGKVLTFPATNEDAAKIVSSGKAAEPAKPAETPKPAEAKTEPQPAASTSLLSGGSVSYYLAPYTVRTGDSLYGICSANGLDYSKNADLILAASGVKNAARIYTGNILLIPSSSAAANGSGYAVVAHKVVAGDTTSAICTSYGVDYGSKAALIAALNPGKSLTWIKADQTLLIPVPAAKIVSSGKAAEPAKPAETPKPTETPAETPKPTETAKPAETTAPSPTPAAGEYNTFSYTLQNGDTVYGICLKKGLDFNKCLGAIMTLNRLSSDAAFRTLRVGRTLTFPASNADAAKVIAAAKTSPAPASGSTQSETKPAAKPNTPAQSSSVKYYLSKVTIQAGDTVLGLCSKRGVDFSSYDKLIRGVNGLKGYNKLHSGDVLWLPSASATSSGYAMTAVTVKAGDTVVSLCKAYGADYSSCYTILQQANAGKNLNWIHTGDVLLIPVPVK